MKTSKKCVAASSSEPPSKKFMRLAKGMVKIPPTPPEDYDSTWFLNAQSEELFTTKFAPKLLIIEREILLEGLSQMHIAERFRSRSWESIITHIVPPSESRVHEFYSNMHNFIDLSFLLFTFMVNI